MINWNIEGNTLPFPTLSNFNTSFTMGVNWNFRAILSLHPESDSFTCVSTKPDNSTRCHNRRPLLSDIDLAKAGGILDAMDRCESLKASYGHLNELARLTLCIIHSEGDDQVELVSAIWQSRIEKHMKTEVETPVRPKSRRSIGRRRTSSLTVMTVLKEEKAEQVRVPYYLHFDIQLTTSSPLPVQPKVPLLGSQYLHPLDKTPVHQFGLVQEEICRARSAL